MLLANRLRLPPSRLPPCRLLSCRLSLGKKFYHLIPLSCF